MSTQNKIQNPVVESDILLSTKGVYHIYTSRAEHASVVALKGITLEIKQGEFVSVVGPSGSGKSSLLRILGGLMRPTAGPVIFQGQDITKTPEEELTVFRRKKIGFVFQEGNLLSDLSAFDNVCQSMALNGFPYTFRRKRTLELLDLMGVKHRKNQIANKLSGGEKQRVAIARALANMPELIIADEPTGNVDYQTSVRLLDLFKELNRDMGTAFLLATHSSFVAKYSDRSIELRDGILLGQHGNGIDLSQLDTSRMVIMDADHRITISQNIIEQLQFISTHWNIDVVDQEKIILSPIKAFSEKDESKAVIVEANICPVCGNSNSLSSKICISCGARF